VRILFLGTAAGGGVPQWNCNCPVCSAARLGDGQVRPRTQSCVAVSSDGRRWFLLNASPDLRSQLESNPALRPPASSTRGSSIEAVLLTNADLDHTLGLFLLREGERLAVHASREIRQSLAEGPGLEKALGAFCGVEWVEPPARPTALHGLDGIRSGLSYEAFELGGRPPRFAKQYGTMRGHNLGYRITDETTGGRFLFLPGVPSLEGVVGKLLPECEALALDGTFWTENEMRDRGVGDVAASAMGHLPISGPAGSLKVLAALKVRHKIYVHINNTNPVLFENSPERAAVVAAGCTVAWDGMEIVI
jgi:pyrroloquinoline quinone biosynthesis protein B